MHTPNGLEIRIDEDDIMKVLGNSYNEFDFDSIGTGVEIWERFSNDFTLVTTLVAAFISQNILITIISFLLGYTLGTIIENFIYSKALSVLFSVFLGNPLIRILLIIANGIYSYFIIGNTGVTIIQAVLALLCIFHITMVILVPIALPIRLLARKTHGNVGGLEMTYLIIINKQAAKLGYTLDWSQASKAH